MLKGSLQQTIDQYRALLRAREKHDEQELERAYAYMLMLIQPALDSLYRQMADAQAEGKTISLLWLYEAGRLENIKRLIREQVDQFAVLAQLQVQQAQQYAEQLGQEAALDMLNAMMPAGERHAVTNLMVMTLSGIPLAYLFLAFGSEAAERAAKWLTTGATLGWNPRKIAPFVQAELGASRNRSLVIARDQINKAYRRTILRLYRANSNIIAGWVWCSELSPHTCIACIIMHGTRHPLSEEMHEHVCGRCTPIPFMRIGAVSNQPPSGIDWFRRQSEVVQKQILGPGKFIAWQQGKFSLRDAVMHDYDPKWGASIREKSLKELLKV
jgi:hypothetical protein